MIKRERMKRRLSIVLFFGYLSFLLFITLFSHNYYTYGQSSNFLILDSVRLMLRSGDVGLILKNIWGNVALFVPFGFLLPLLIPGGSAFRRILLLGFLVSLAIETCQQMFASRIFDVDDILLNVAGALFGRVLLAVCRFFIRHVIFFYLS
ncbi:VanZ family protein [Sporolactobacillus sp. THM7-7]|nr:VanZ family protein [Sporolactobacillus sp. THM7-7]